MGVRTSEALRRLAGVPVLRCVPAMASRSNAAIPVLVLVLGTLLSLVVACMRLGSATDTDAWFLLSTGRQILESGIPRGNPWAIEAGLRVVVQQWLHDVWLFALFEAGGFAAVSASMILPLSLFYASLAWLCREAAGRRLPAYVIAGLLGVATFLSMAWVTVRPTLWTMALSCACAAASARAARTGDNRWLVLPPVIVAVHVNLHASMAWLDLFAVACAALPPTTGEARRALDRPLGWAMRRAAVIRCIACMLACMFLNPYGVDGVTYLFDSYGVATYRDLIQELRHPWLVIPISMAVWLAGTVVLPTVLCIFWGHRALPPLPAIAGVLVGTAAGLSSARSMWISVPPAMAIIAWAWARSHTREGAWNALSKAVAADLPRLHGAGATLACSVVPPLLALALAATLPGGLSVGVQGPSSDGERPTYLPYQLTWDYMPREVGPLLDEIEASGTRERVYADIIVNNYLEWERYPVMLDARPEIWEPAISGDSKHIYLDYADTLDFTEGSSSATVNTGKLRRYVDANSVRWLILGKGELSGHDGAREGYELVAETDYYELWRVADRPVGES